MSIWQHDHLAHPWDIRMSSELLTRRTCLYCKKLLIEFQPLSSTIERRSSAFVRACVGCGWWFVEEQTDSFEHPRYSGGFASLKNLDVRQIDTPVHTVRQYLLASYKSRFDTHPRIYEETVASVFRDLGYFVRVTSFSRDNGIDIYLDGPDGALIGVQVKRWASSIKIDQIHSLGGALLVNGCTEGIFVTTSSFQKGAVINAGKLGAITGIPIHLVDSEKLFAALSIVARPALWSPEDDSAPWNSCPRRYLYTE